MGRPLTTVMELTGRGQCSTLRTLPQTLGEKTKLVIVTQT